MIPGWPYSVIAALEPGRTSWTAVLDAIRLGPDDDEAVVTAAQVREVVARLIEAGHWGEGDSAILVIFDAGYDVTRLAFLLTDLPVELLGRLRSDRVMKLPAPPRQPGTSGRPRKHGRELALATPATWPDPQITTSTVTSRYGTAVATAWDRVHPRLTHRAAWLDHDGDLPVIEGTLIRLQAGHLPGDRDPKPVWLWCSATGALPAEVDRLWQAFLRRFDLEHTFRLFKQVLGWTTPKIRQPQAADRWTWLIIAVFTDHPGRRTPHPGEPPPRRLPDRLTSRVGDVRHVKRGSGEDAWHGGWLSGTCGSRRWSGPAGAGRSRSCGQRARFTSRPMRSCAPTMGRAPSGLTPFYWWITCGGWNARR